ncbi:MAG: hypothetical protein HDT28_07645 [Clostridiales bacterium]|nr:hypothetical protein [Clostridiales bacterium]
MKIIFSDYPKARILILIKFVEERQGIADYPKEKYIEKLVFDEKLSFEFRKG